MPKSIKFSIFKKKALLGCLFFIVIIGAFLFFGHNWAQAQTDPFGMNYPAQLGLPNQDPRVAIMQLVRIALGFIGIIAVILIMYAGYVWMTSAGNNERIERAKKILTNAVIGLIIILAAFLIVSFIINQLLSTGFGSPDSGSPRGRGGGIGALGNCAIESVYPAPMQTEVPRNTSLVVTFKDIINPTTVFDPSGYILTNSVKLFKSSDDPNNPLNLVANVRATTNDNKIFVFTPVNYLGSPTEYIWYSVLLTNDIKNTSGQGIFDKCGVNKDFEWKFEISNKLDLTPPQVVQNNVFPFPDDTRDTISGSSAVAATGSVTVLSQPQGYAAASLVGVTSVGTSPAASVNVDPHCQTGGALTVTVLTNGHTAELRQGSILLGSAEFISGAADFTNLFTITVSGSVAAGNQWNLTITAEARADTLTVGNIVYTFTSTSPSANEIQIGASTNSTASNIGGALNTNPSVSAVATGNRVALTARVAGRSGNNIAILTVAGSRLSTQGMSGGTDGGQIVTISDQKDQPRNSVIQINFNEGMNPLTLSGSADNLRNYLRVVNAESGALGAGASCTSDSECLSFKCATTCVNDYLAGKFVISNQYRTVEFLSDNVCGVNGCGEKIYCLPANSHIRVDIMAAALDGCTNCAAKAPFTSCIGGHCYNSLTSQNYPLSASPLSGAADLAMNSLDGDRGGDAEGPAAFYDENVSSGNGDNYQWSFYINDLIDLTPPIINLTVPAHVGTNASLSEPVRITFSKLMMSYSLSTGSRLIDNGQREIEHRMINIWNFSKIPVGYWIIKTDIDIAPLDGYPDLTQGEINHGLFADTTSYRSEVGSGVKDIYQNCFSPSSGTTCTATQTNRSCCPTVGALNPTTVPEGQGCP